MMKSMLLLGAIFCIGFGLGVVAEAQHYKRIIHGMANDAITRMESLKQFCVDEINRLTQPKAGPERTVIITL